MKVYVVWNTNDTMFDLHTNLLVFKKKEFAEKHLTDIYYYAKENIKENDEIIEDIKGEDGYLITCKTEFGVDHFIGKIEETEVI